MKRFILVAACALVALCACTKPEKNESTLPVAKYKDYHASYTLKGPNFDGPIKSGKVPQTIDLTSGGKFVLGFRDNDAAKPDAPLIYKSGIYSVIESKAVSAGLMFIFPMYGDLTIKSNSGNNWEVEYTTASGETFDGTAILTGEQISGELAEDVCRSWKPYQIIVSASGEDMTAIVGKIFNNDISEICSYLKEKGVDINPADYAQYTLESIDFTESGMMVINFKDFAIAPFVGNFNLKESNDENLAYNFNLSWEDNPVIPVSGVGSVTVSGSQLTLYTESDAVISGKTYHISASILCNEIK